MIERAELKQLMEDCYRVLHLMDDLVNGHPALEPKMENDRVEITKALRELAIANEIEDRYIIAVSGLQGVGKTTLMQNYYDLDPAVMNATLGIGERLPVFITEEQGVTEPQLYIARIIKDKDGYHTEKEKVAAEDFKQALQTDDIKTHNLYLEIEVPIKYRKGDKYSFMLLPGFQGKSKLGDDYWNTLIKFSLNCSDTAIWVTTSAKLAGGEDQDARASVEKEITDHFIYAITHSDSSQDDNEEARKTLLKAEGIKSAEADRVICTGSYSDDKPEKNAAWKKALNSAIEKYRVSHYQAKENSKMYFREILKKLKRISREIRGLVNKAAAGGTAGIDEEWLKAFDDAVAKQRKKYEKTLREETEKYRQADRAALAGAMQEQSKDVWKNLKRQLFGPNVGNVAKREEMIDKVMKNDDGGSYRYVAAYARAFAVYAHQICAKPEEEGAGTMAIWEMANNWPLPAPLEDVNERAALILQDATTILALRKIDGKLPELQSQNAKKLMKVIAESATQYFGLYMADRMYDCIKDDTARHEMEQSGLQFAELKGSISDTKKFGIGVLGIAGADLLGDGVLDLIPTLASTLHIPLAVANAAAATVGLLGMAAAVIRDGNRMEMTEYRENLSVINNVYQEQRKKCLDCYDEYMDAIKIKICEYLEATNGTNKAAVCRQNARTVLTNIEEMLDHMLENVEDDRDADLLPVK